MSMTQSLKHEEISRRLSRLPSDNPGKVKGEAAQASKKRKI